MMPIDVRKLEARRRFRLLQGDLPAVANSSRPRGPEAAEMGHGPKTADPPPVRTLPRHRSPREIRAKPASPSRCWPPGGSSSRATAAPAS
jgi:hypothetical protein